MLHRHWSLIILGDGPLRKPLERLSVRLGIQARVKFTGFVNPPFDVLRQGELFVLSSVLEGFPCSLVEAMACGLAVIATKYNDGVEEILVDGENGLVVHANDEAQLAHAMHRAMDDRGLRESLADNAKLTADRFSLPIVMKKWDQLIQETSGEGSRG